MAIRGGEIISYLELDTGRYSAAMRAAQAEAGAFAASNAGLKGKLDAVMNGTAAIGRVMTAGVTVPVVTGFAAAGRAAMSFESAFAGVKKTVDATEQGYANLNKQLLEMGRVVPKTHEELAGIMEIAGQLGVKEKDLTGFTRTIADLAVSTNLTEEAGASMLAQFANVVGMDLSNIDRLGSVIVDLGNNTATTEKDIVEMAQRLSGAGALLNLTEAQIMGLAATMSSLGINAEAGGSAMSRILQKMHKAVLEGSDDLKTWAKTAGMSEAAFKQAFGADPLKALTAFIGGLNGLSEAGGNVYDVLDEVGLKDVRITDSMLRLSGAQGQLEENISRASKAWQENTALTKEAEQRYKTTESRVKLAKNSIREAGITLGNAFLPVIGDAADKVAGLAQGFADLDDESKKQITTGLGITAAIGPATLLLKGLIGLLTGPGGLIAAGALAVGGMVAIDRAAEQVTFAQLDAEMGSIKLSAEDIKAIVKEGFGEPLIDFSNVTSARGEAEKALTAFSNLQDQLAKDVYMAKMGLRPMSEKEIEQQVSSLVSAAQDYLNKEENAAILTVTSYFGEKTEDAAGIVSGIEKHMGAMRSQMAAKGKELGDALKNAIADGTIDSEEQGVIARLQRELSEIAARGTLIDAQSKADVLIAKAQYGGITMESIKQGAAEMETYRKELLENYTKERDLVLEEIARLKNYGAFSQEEYDRRVADTFNRYGNLSGDTALSTMELGWNMFGRQLAQNFMPKVQEARDIYSIPGFSMDANDPENLENRSRIIELGQQAQRTMSLIGPLMSVFESVEQELGGEMPEAYKGMLEVFRQINRLAGMDEQYFKDEEFKSVDLEKVDAAVAERAEKMRLRTEEATKNASDVAQKNMDAAQTAVDASAPAIKESADKAAGQLPAAMEAQKDPTATAAGEAMTGAAGQAGEGAQRMDAAVQDGLSGLPGAMGSIGTNAAGSLIGALAAKVGAAKEAGAKLGSAVEQGAKSGLQIASPSKKMIAIAGNVVGTLAGTINGGLGALVKAGAAIGASLVGSTNKSAKEAYKDGFVETLFSGRLPRPANTGGVKSIVPDGFFAPGGAGWRDIGLDKKTTTDRRSGRVGGGGSREDADIYIPTIAAMPAFNLDTSAVQNLKSQRERLLSMAGGWRAYYDKTEQEKALEAVEKKYKALIDAETKGFEALDSESKQNQQKAHQDRLTRIRDQQREETDLVKGNYDLQKRLATDWLTAQGDILSAAFQQKQEQLQQEDYEKTVADLERRIRQTRSARERRELNEQLEQVKQDEALRLEQQQLSSTLAGINALKTAVGAGVIGLNDLTGLTTIGSYGAGLKHVQGITAEQLATVLDKLKGGGSDYGNHYTIDLSGAVIRDDSDIDRIVEGFERETRSYQRDFRNN